VREDDSAFFLMQVLLTGEQIDICFDLDR